MVIDLDSVLRRQHQMLSRSQALDGVTPLLTPATLRARLGRDWQVVLPGVYAAFTGALTGHQRAAAALLHAGSGAMLTGSTALALYRVRALPRADVVHVLVPASTAPRSRDFVVVTRTTRLPRPRKVDGYPCAPPARAAVDFALRADSARDVRAVVAEVVQRGLVSVDALRAEHAQAPARGRAPLTCALTDVTAGIRAAGEATFRDIVRGRPLLPEPLWNPLIRLPDGRVISPDALIVEARLIHETNGRRYHAGEDEFEDMQERHDVLTAAGFTVLHNTPRRLDRQPRTVGDEFEACYLRQRGLGLPPGVTLLRDGPSA